MRYRTFAGEQVSQITLGTWGIGGIGWDQTAEEEKIAAIRTMLDHGVNLIDSAPAYNAGVAERIVGKAIKGRRDKLFLVTKTGNFFINGTYVRDGRRHKIIEQCHQSLKDMQTDYIDYYLIHWPDPKVHIGETMEALEQLRQEGKIRYVGVSNFEKSLIETASQYGKIDVIQPHYSMLKRESEPLMQWAFQNDIHAMVYGALGGGLLSGAYRKPPVLDPSDNRSRFYKYFQEPAFSEVSRLLTVMDEIAAERGNVSLSQIALNWILAHEFVSTAICGVQKVRHAQDNCKAMDWELTQEEFQRLNDVLFSLKLEQ